MRKGKERLAETRLATYTAVEELKRKRTATHPRVSSDQAGWTAESTPTLESGLRMQRNIPNGGTEPKSHQRQDAILKDLSSKWLAPPKEEEQMGLGVK